MPVKLPVVIGERRNMWTVLEEVGTNGTKNLLLCRCDCGTLKQVQKGHFRSGASRNCGCVRRVTFNNKIHGESKRSSEYQSWRGMRERCTSPSHIGYRNYGGRGVTICDRWLKSFAHFLEDMGRKPSSKHSIDRIDSNGSYNPSNCRWATPREQANNMCRNVFIAAYGKRQTMAQWARELGLSAGAIISRYHRGHSPEDICFKGALPRATTKK